MNLLEFASHLEEKAAQLHHEGLGCIKMALAGTNTSTLLETLEEVFGQVDLDTTTSSTSTETIVTEKQPKEPLIETSKDVVTPLVEENKLATARLMFPMKSIPLVIAGLLNHYYLFVVERPSPVIGVNLPPVILNFHRKWPHAILSIMTT